MVPSVMNLSMFISLNWSLFRSFLAISWDDWTNYPNCRWQCTSNWHYWWWPIMMSQKPGSKLNRGSNGSTRFENWTKAESRTDRTENELEIENGLSIRTCLLCGPEQGRELHTRNGAYWARAGYIGAHGLKQLALSFNSKLLSFFLFFFPSMRSQSCHLPIKWDSFLFNHREVEALLSFDG